MDYSQPTKRQMRVLRMIASGAASGIQPSIRDIMKRLRISSPNGVTCHLEALEKKGFIKRSSRKASRSIVVNWDKYPEEPPPSPRETAAAIAKASRMFLRALGKLP
jgi:repressor LexA